MKLLFFLIFYGKFQLTKMSAWLRVVKGVALIIFLILLDNH